MTRPVHAFTPGRCFHPGRRGTGRSRAIRRAQSRPRMGSPQIAVLGRRGGDEWPMIDAWTSPRASPGSRSRSPSRAEVSVSTRGRRHDCTVESICRSRSRHPFVPKTVISHACWPSRSAQSADRSSRTSRRRCCSGCRCTRARMGRSTSPPASRDRIGEVPGSCGTGRRWRSTRWSRSAGCSARAPTGRCSIWPASSLPRRRSPARTPSSAGSSGWIAGSTTCDSSAGAAACSRRWPACRGSGVFSGRRRFWSWPIRAPTRCSRA